MILSSFVWIGYQRVTDRRTELPWLIQRSVLQAMWPRCKHEELNYYWYLTNYPIIIAQNYMSDVDVSVY